MYRSPAVRPQQSPGAPRPQGRFISPTACWGSSVRQSPYGSPGHHRGGSPRGGYNPAYSSGSPAYSPVHLPGYSPGYSPGPNRGFSPGSSPGYSPGYRGFSPGGFRGGPRGNGGPIWRRGGGFHRRGYGSGHKSQSRSSDIPVEEYCSPSMLEDPWAGLEAISEAEIRKAAS